MIKYQQKEKMSIFLISEICKKSIFKDIKENREQLEEIGKILLQEKDQNVEQTL